MFLTLLYGDRRLERVSFKLSPNSVFLLLGSTFQILRPSLFVFLPLFNHYSLLVNFVIEFYLTINSIYGRYRYFNPVLSLLILINL